jgi:preprotein translocase subunit YajC
VRSPEVAVVVVMWAVFFINAELSARSQARHSRYIRDLTRTTEIEVLPGVVGVVQEEQVNQVPVRLQVRVVQAYLLA